MYVQGTYASWPSMAEMATLPTAPVLIIQGHLALDFSSSIQWLDTCAPGSGAPPLDRHSALVVGRY